MKVVFTKMSQYAKWMELQEWEHSASDNEGKMAKL